MLAPGAHERQRERRTESDALVAGRHVPEHGYRQHRDVGLGDDLRALVASSAFGVDRQQPDQVLTVGTQILGAARTSACR